MFNVGGTGNTSIRDIERFTGISATVLNNAHLEHYGMDVSELSYTYPLKSSNDYVKEYLGEAGHEGVEQPL